VRASDDTGEVEGIRRVGERTDDGDDDNDNYQSAAQDFLEFHV
jgi:hypothetical protein